MEKKTEKTSIAEAAPYVPHRRDRLLMCKHNACDQPMMYCRLGGAAISP